MNLRQDRAWLAGGLLLLLLLATGIGMALRHRDASPGARALADVSMPAPSARGTLPPEPVGRRPRERTAEQEAQRRAALDLAARLVAALTAHQKSMEDFQATLPDLPPHLPSTAEIERMPKFPAALEEELQGMNPLQLSVVAQVLAEDAALNGQDRAARLGFVFGNWMNGQQPDSALPLVTALGLMEKYLPDLTLGSVNLLMLSVMPNSGGEEKSTAMADFIISNRDLWAGAEGDSWSGILRMHLLQSGIDAERKKLIEGILHNPGER